MSKTVICALTLLLLIIPVRASSLEAPPVMDSSAEFMPEVSDTFDQALLKMLQKILPSLRPDLAEAINTCVRIIAMSVFLAILPKDNDQIRATVSITGVAFTCISLLSGTCSLIRLAANTVMELAEYSKLLFPVLTTALAASGSVSSSAALYSGTILFSTVLCNLMQAVLIPAVYLFLASAASCNLFDGDILKKTKEHLKKGIIWLLKTAAALFISCMGITGIVGNTADAAKLKAVRTAVSAAVPVIGNTLANASDAILLGAGIAKNAAGIYGIYAMLAIFLSPFLKIAVHYVILKAGSLICGIFDEKSISGLLDDFTSAMSLLLAQTGTLCMVHLFSILCYMKGGGM